MELVKNNIKLLSDMLTHYSPGVDQRLENNDIIQDLHRACLDMRPKMFKLAGELDEKSETLGEVLNLNDELTRVIDLYREVQKAQVAALAGGAQPKPASAAGLMGDFASLSVSNPATQHHSTGLDDDLLSDFTGGHKPAAAAAPVQAQPQSSWGAFAAPVPAPVQQQQQQPAPAANVSNGSADAAPQRQYSSRVMADVTGKNTRVSKICVAVRKRPLNRKEQGRNDTDVLTVSDQTRLTVHEPKFFSLSLSPSLSLACF